MTGDTGKIRFPSRAFQHIDFSGIRYGNATPSNVDGVLELEDRLFVILEYKHASAQPMSKGQRTMIERITDGLDIGGRYAIAVIGIHNSPVGEIIDGANSQAVEVRWKSEWKSISHKNFTVKQCVDRAYNIAFHEPF
jgi:hypothetical protein